MATKTQISRLPFAEGDTGRDLKRISNGARNKLFPEDRAAHEWYRFVLSFPPQLVREYVERFLIDKSRRVLDPFCGTGTTLVECKKLGIPSVGLEAHPMPALASKVKTDWSVGSLALKRYAYRVAKVAEAEIRRPRAEFRVLAEDAHKLLLKGSISPVPLHKTLILLEAISSEGMKPCSQHALLALATALVKDIGNLHFGPEVGARGHKDDAPVVDLWLSKMLAMADDLKLLRDKAATESRVWQHDSRSAVPGLRPASIDAVITSPPYPNEKDYTRTTRLESVLLGLINSRKELRQLKEGLLRSNTRNVYKADTDDEWIEKFPDIQAIARRIEERRKELGKTSGFERLYHRVAKLYFGGMARHFADLRPLLRPGARLAYVVGDQASFLRVMIRTGQILAQVAESLGYEVESIDLFRTRLSTVTKEHLREEALVLRWPG
jgi:SAM-dependent methyltransferase